MIIFDRKITLGGNSNISFRECQFLFDDFLIIEPRCRFHQVHCPELFPNKSWPRKTIVSSGLECIDHSSMGNRAGISGRSALNHTVFMHFRNILCEEETAVCIEESALYKTHALRRIYGECAEQAAGRDWEIQEEKLCPSFFGFPMTRLRKWIIITNGRRIRMTVPFAEFCQGFFRTLAPDGDYC